MITLITGKPGMGKTSLLVSLLMEIEGTRPIYVMGVPDLTIEHFKCPPVEDWTERRKDPDDPSLELPYFTFPPDSLVVLDEAQRVYRPRSSGSKVPDYVAAFETHRHTGIDFILLTQSPKLLDANIRELVGKHIAIGNRLLGRYLYEWPYVGDIDSKLYREEAAKRRFKPPRKAFDKYKSAEVHTKHKFRLNQVFIYLAAALALFVWAGARAYETVQRNTQKPAASPAVLSAPRSGEGQPAQATPPTPPSVLSLPSHPYEGSRFYLKAVLSDSKRHISYYKIVGPQGESFISSDSLQNMGYKVVVLGDCAARIYYVGKVITAFCETVVPGFKPMTSTANH